MRRRAVAIVKASPIMSVDLVPFLSPLDLNDNMTEACKRLAQRANRYNKYDFVNSVVRGIKMRAASRVITLQDVEKVMDIEERKLQR